MASFYANVGGDYCIIRRQRSPRCRHHPPCSWQSSADEAVEQSAQHVLLEVPAVYGPPDIVGDLPNAALQFCALLLLVMVMDGCQKLKRRIVRRSVHGARPGPVVILVVSLASGAVGFCGRPPWGVRPWGFPWPEAQAAPFAIQSGQQSRAPASAAPPVAMAISDVQAALCLALALVRALEK